jgi:hypothetical protein
MNHLLRKIIAVFQVSGAALAAIGLGYELFYVPFQTALVFLAAYLFAACALAISGGLLLWRDRRAGYRLSIAAQAAQIPLVSSTLISYGLIFGFGAWVSLTVSAENWNAGIDFRLGELHQLHLFSEGVPVSIGINFVALYFAVMLWRALRALPAK